MAGCLPRQRGLLIRLCWPLSSSAKYPRFMISASSRVVTPNKFPLQIQIASSLEGVIAICMEFADTVHWPDRSGIGPQTSSASQRIPVLREIEQLDLSAPCLVCMFV